MTTKPRTRKITAETPSAEPSLAAASPSKLELFVSLMSRPDGASLAELVAATGWQPHSVRGALAGSLKRKGHAIVSERVDGERRYRIGAGK